MKKVYFMSMALAAMLAMAGCSNDDIAGVGGDDATTTTLAEGEGIVAINLSNTGIGTRAARPLGSSAAANDVNKVKLVVYSGENAGSLSEDKNVKMSGQEQENEIIVDWTATTDTELEWDNSHDDKKSVKLSGLQANRYYKIVAYGYNAESGDAPAFAVADGDNTGEFKVAQFTAPEEVFAGASETVQANANGKFNSAVQVEMDRQVAGMLAYIKNVPTRLLNASGEMKVVKFVKVLAKRKVAGIKFPSTTDFNGLTVESPEEDEEVALLTFNMENIAENWAGGNPTESAWEFNDYTNGKIESGKTKNPFAEGYTAPTGLTLVEGSIFGACYLLPYDKHYSEQTLTIELQDADGNALKTLNVNTTATAKPSDGTINAYDIRRNNFYSIGRKFAVDNTDGDTDDDDEPGTDDPDDNDDPVDVGSSNDALLIIHDNWKMLHQMTVEEA